MNGQDQNLFAYILDLSDERAAVLHAELAEALFAEHERRRRARRADPPSEARFAVEIGMKPNTYSKARRRADVGQAPRWSRKSLAMISLCRSLPREIAGRAYVLLWRDLLHGPIAAQGVDVRRAITSRELFNELEDASASEFIVTLGNQEERAAMTGGANAS